MGKNDIRVVYAGYGWVNQVYDATTQIQKAVDNGTKSIGADNNLVGDPAFGHKKSLFIVWKRGDDNPQFGVTMEGEPGIVVNPD